MSVFSITALDRLIESDRRSSSPSTTASTTASMEKQSYGTTSGERRPLYVSYPYSSTTSTSLSPRPRSPSPTSFSPSPYIVNHKRRVPNGVDSKRASQQNGFHVSDRSTVSRPSESQELVVRLGDENHSQDRSLNGDVVGKLEHDMQVKEHTSPQSTLTREFQSKITTKDSEEKFELKNKRADESYVHGGLPVTEEKAKGRKGGVDRKDMSSRFDDLRGKKKLEDKLEEGASTPERPRVDWGISSSSARSPHVPTSENGSSTIEEWYDAPEAPLSEDFSDDEGFRTAPSNPGPSSRGDPDPTIVSQLKEEIKRRMRAEEALEALQQQRDGMAQMLCTAGISLPRSDEDTKLRECERVGLSDSEAQRLLVARCIAGAVARGAVRAEAEAELQTVLAEKSKEIARLRDKLQYYELVNHEMSQRNQEAIEIARQSRRRRQRRQQFAVLGLSAAICFGVSAAIAYHYLPWEQIKSYTKGSPLYAGEHVNSETVEKVVELGEPITES